MAVVQYYSEEKGGWFQANVTRRGARLEILFSRNVQREVINMATLVSQRSITELQERFRLPNSKIRRCQNLRLNSQVCAVKASTSRDDSTQVFCDAFIQNITRGNHAAGDTCNCRFNLSWLHADYTTTVGLADLESINEGHTAIVAAFLRDARSRIA